MRRPEFVLDEAIREYSFTTQTTIELPQGSHITPVHEPYLPRHLREEAKNKLGIHTPLTHTFCYTRHGFVLIANRHIRKI